MANDIIYDLTPWQDAPSTLTPINAENLNARDSLLKKVVDKTNQLSEQIGDHKEDSTTHVTSVEKQIWNDKSNFSGSWDDLTNKPTIPTVPTSLKNPYKLTISLGSSSYTYDGSEAINITIEDGSEVIY